VVSDDVAVGWTGFVAGFVVATTAAARQVGAAAAWTTAATGPPRA